MTRVAINGFGRIGRLAFRKMHEDKDIDILIARQIYHEGCTVIIV